MPKSKHFFYLDQALQVDPQGGLAGICPEPGCLAGYSWLTQFHARAGRDRDGNPLIIWLIDGLIKAMMQQHARHGIAEHHEMDELIEKIDETDMDSPAWLTYAKQLCEKVEHHLEDEEQTFFQLSGKVFTEQQKTALAKDVTPV